MSLLSRLLARRWRLPAALHRQIHTQHLRIPMRDGVELVAQRHYSADGGAQPTILVRSCYGIPGVLGTLFAERGFQVILQNCRGVGGSQGVFRPFFDEQSDGEDTVAWIARQPWFQGDLALWGMSYLGNTAWAIANSPAAAHVKAMGLHVTLSDFRDRTYAFGGFTLLSCIGWTITMSDVLRDGGMKILLALTRARRTRILTEKATGVLPLKAADRVVAPEGFAWWQDWMAHAEPGDPWWRPVHYSAATQGVPPTVMTTGWHDIFLPWQLRDFIAARHAGRDVRLIIGPWMHADADGIAESLRESICLFQERFGLGAAGAVKARVRLFLQGANEWREYPSWPIPHAIERKYYLNENGLISEAAPADGGVRRFDYDPAQPTPSLHGPTLEGKSGSGDVAELERRSDVLVYTTEALAGDLDVVGPVSGEVFLRSSTLHTDLYLCLCDVTAAGRSTNVCDGYVRLHPEAPPALRDGVRKVDVEFWPTAYRFRRGNRLRILVSSGAHPRYGRNPGTGAPLGEARQLMVARQEILHGPEYPTLIVVHAAGSG